MSDRSPIQRAADALAPCAVCGEPTGIIVQGPLRMLCMSCALGRAIVEGLLPDPARPDSRRLALGCGNDS